MRYERTSVRGREGENEVVEMRLRGGLDGEYSGDANLHMVWNYFMLLNALFMFGSFLAVVILPTPLLTCFP